MCATFQLHSSVCSPPSIRFSVCASLRSHSSDAETLSHVLNANIQQLTAKKRVTECCWSVTGLVVLLGLDEPISPLLKHCIPGVEPLRGNPSFDSLGQWSSFLLMWFHSSAFAPNSACVYTFCDVTARNLTPRKFATFNIWGGSLSALMNALILLRHFHFSRQSSLLWPLFIVPAGSSMWCSYKQKQCPWRPLLYLLRWLISSCFPLILFWEPSWLHSSHQILLNTDFLFRSCNVLVFGATVAQ